MEQQAFALSSCDDSFSFLLESNTNSCLRDEMYAEELQLQETVIASLINPTSKKRSLDCGESSSHKTKKGPFGKSSQDLCEICAENRDSGLMFSVPNCTHRFCTECITKHVEVKLQKCPSGNLENARTLPCPCLDCKGVLEIDSCRNILPGNIISLWEDVVCESMIDSSQKFYCPYKNCSGLIVNDSRDGEIEESECPFCHRLFCARCRVPWHSGIGCKVFSKLNKNERGREDLMVYELAKRKKWRRCPRCKFFVEKNGGCLHITCRCRYQFCYACGAMWSSTHGGCQ